MRQRRYISLGILAGLVIGLLWTAPVSAQASLFVVNSWFDDTDAHDANPGDCICADTYGVCTLRAAVEEANACSGPDTITFKFAMNIDIDTNLTSLALNETATVDASDVWNSLDNAPGVTINGGDASFAGLYLGGDSCEIYGLYITNFDGAGILAFSASNTIGGTGAGQRNVLSGNSSGLDLSGASVQNNVIRNNYIGLTPAGTTKNPNETGIVIANGASNNVVGGNQAAQANYISGNTYSGITIEGSGTDNNQIMGNAIGLGTDLSTNLGNGSWGIRIINGPSNTVIGGASNSGNFISYSTYSGISALNAGSGTQVTHNIIGGNGSDGVEINNSSGLVVSDNWIASNALDGVRVVGASAAGNLIWPNSIHGNGSKGIHLQSGGNMSIAAPVINSASTTGASGTTCASCRVALYSDSSDEGQVYHDIVWADVGGNWSYTGALFGPNVTATSIDGSGNTSEFSAPYEIIYRVHLPLVLRRSF